MVDNIKATSVSIAATTVAGGVQGAYVDDGQYVRVYNSGSAVVFVNSGDDSVTAASSNQPIGAGEARVLMKDTNDSHMAALSSSSTQTIYLTPATVD